MELEINSFAQFAFRHLDELQGNEIDMHLLRAQFADRCRDCSVMPVKPDEFGNIVEACEKENQKRIAISVHALSDDDTRTAAFLKRTGEQVIQSFVQFSEQTRLLTTEILNDSALRREEFIRHFAAFFAAGISGESAEESKQRLERIDYRKLLAEAEKAKASAEDQLAYLRKLQEEQEEQYAPRGKI